MSETISIREGEDFDLEAAERYLRAHVEDVPEGELEVSQFPSGASNLTYLLKVGDWEGVLRRPPLGPVPPKAHDMGRESGILARLNAVYPLAPKPYFFCEDESVIGAPFYVMERRTGIVLDDSFPDGVEHDEELCHGISRYERAKTDEIEEASPLTDWLASDIPESPPPSVIHNDYKLNNLVSTRKT